MLPEGWYLVQHFAKGVWDPVPKAGVLVPNLYESVPITIPSMDVFGFPRTNFNFNNAENHIDATMCSGMVWSCPLVSSKIGVDDIF